MAGLRRYRDLILAAVAALLAATLRLAAQEPLPGLYDRPVLALDSGVHTAVLSRVDVDAAGRIAVTGSHDKTVRVWSVADGSLLRTIRMPTGPGDVGKINAVAISPDGSTIAAGGWTRWTEEDPQEQIYFFDAGTGAMTSRLDRLPDIVGHLAFSSDGRRLAAVLAAGGMRLYQRNGAGRWEELARDVDYGGQRSGAAFAGDGRLATTSLDGRLRLYDADGTLIHSVASGHARPIGLAFNPADGRLAVGFDDTTEVLLYDGETLVELPAPDVGGIDNGDLSKVAWSADGATLFAAGQYPEGEASPVIAWATGGAGPRQALQAGLETVMSLRPLPDGGLLVASADPWLGVIGPDGALRWNQAPVQMDPRGQESNLGVSPDGMVVDFGFEFGGEARGRFDVTALQMAGRRD